MKRRDLSRRGFLRSALAGAAGVSVAGSPPAQAEPSNEAAMAEQPKAPPKYADYLKEANKGNAVLALTDDNIEGPFYRPGAPVRTDGKLYREGDKGDVLVVSGQVVGQSGDPIPSAVLDVWHTNAFGRYDNDDSEHPPAEDEFRFRGKIRVNAKGEFRFETVRPGHYKLTPGQYRTAHVHFKVTGDGYRLLTSQFFFRGEQYNATDPWFKPGMVLDLKPQDGKFVATVRIVLAKA
jgi:protocatechuate 3,4-dioxygenase beta subunit